MRHCRACAHYSDFLDRPQQITQKLPKQGYVSPRLKSSLQKLYGRHHDLVDRYEISIPQMTITFYVDYFLLLSLPRLLPDMTVYTSITRVSYKKQELITLREHLGSPPVFLVGSMLLIFLVFMCCLIMYLYVLSSMLWCPLRFPHKHDVLSVFTSSCL